MDNLPLKIQAELYLKASDGQIFRGIKLAIKREMLRNELQEIDDELGFMSDPVIAESVVEEAYKTGEYEDPILKNCSNNYLKMAISGNWNLEELLTIKYGFESRLKEFYIGFIVQKYSTK